MNANRVIICCVSQDDSWRMFSSEDLLKGLYPLHTVHFLCLLYHVCVLLLSKSHYIVGNKPKKTRKSKLMLNKENIQPQVQGTHTPYGVASTGIVYFCNF